MFLKYISPVISLAYDAVNRLTNMIDGIGATAYGYDAVGQLLSETDPWANDMVSYGYTARMRASLSLQQINADPWNQTYGYDGARHVTALINGLQFIAAKYMYDPYGNLLSKVGSIADLNPYQFSSKEHHANSGLIYYLYRFYDPNLQRWQNRDPLGSAAALILAPFSRPVVLNNPVESFEGPNLFCFVWNQPSRFADYWGLSCGSDSRPWWKPGSDATVPDAPFGYDFNAACEAHDRCYGTCGANKAQCDKMLQGMAQFSCAQSSSPGSLGLGFCRMLADIYYEAVSKGGKSDFANAQKAACSACPQTQK